MTEALIAHRPDGAPARRGSEGEGA